mmetsp:Transcript_84256/g.117110  ORF Transcript_84256/g.117110 Transcript_84256/m.117110 type:complete len:232 (-) Transcript_84256:91-786(-)
MRCIPRSDDTRSLTCPTARKKVARTTAAGTFRFFAGSLSSQPKSPARSPLFIAVSHSEISLHFAVNAAGPPLAICGRMCSICVSASPTVRVGFFRLSPNRAWHPAYRKRRCLQRTFVRPLDGVSVFRRFPGSCPREPDQLNRTAAATKGGSPPTLRASSRSATHPARGRSAMTCDRAKARILAEGRPEVRTPFTVRSAPKWLSSRTAQCVVASASSFSGPSTSKLSTLPSD